MRPIFSSADPTDAAALARRGAGAVRGRHHGHARASTWRWAATRRRPVRPGAAGRHRRVAGRPLVRVAGRAIRPALESRAHPLGIAVETRALGWNFPSGNQDIIYFIYTFYNITSTNPADYAAIRPAHAADVLLQKAADFQALNTAKYGINLRPAATPSTTCSPRSWRTWTWPRPTPTTPASTCRSRWATPTSTPSAARPEPRLDLRSGHLRLGAVLPRRRLRGREVPPQPDRPGHRPGGRPDAVRHVLPVVRLAAGPERRQAALPLHHRRPAADRRRLLAAEPAPGPDLLRQHQQPGRHAVLRVVRPARPGARAARARSWWPTSSPRRSRRVAARAPAATSSRPASNADLTILGDPARMAAGVNKIDTHDRVSRLQQR